MEHLITPNMVALTKDEYTQLVQYKDRYEILLPVLIKTSALSWDKKHLRFDEDAVSAILYGIELAAYQCRLEQLKREADDD